MQTWFINTQKLKTLPDLHSFIHTEHTCYSVAHQVICLPFAWQCTPCWQVAEDMQHWRRHNQALSCTPICNACTDLHIAQLAGASNFDVAISAWLCSSITTQSAYFAGSIWAYRAG